MKIVSPGTNRTPPPTPSRPPTMPPAKPNSAAKSSSISAPSPDDQLRRHHEQQHGKQKRDQSLLNPLLERRSGNHPGKRRNADEQRLRRVHVPVQRLTARREG